MRAARQNESLTPGQPGLLQHNQHDSHDHPISKDSERGFFDSDVAKSGKADCQRNYAPEVKEVEGIEDLVYGSAMIELESEK